MCAIEAGKRGRRVAILERAERLGKKILISGGGRCNFTNLYCRPDNFISANPHFAKSALARYTPADFIALIEKHNIPYYEKTLGQLFCKHSARDVVAMLEEECRRARCNILLNTKITEVARSEFFSVKTNDIEFRAPALVVATGGLSIPKIGATSFGYDLARQFGVKLQEPRPALVPLVMNSEDHDHYCDLSGVSADVIASCDGQRFREKMLITHRGLSGPAILQISSYWKKPDSVHIDLLPGKEATSNFADPTLVRTLSALAIGIQEIPAAPSRRPMGRASCPIFMDECRPRHRRKTNPRLGSRSRRYRRLRQGRGDRRWRRYQRTFCQDHGMCEHSRAVLYRRGR